MPAFNLNQSLYAVSEGDSVNIVNNEQLGTGVYSQPVAIADKSPGVQRAITLVFSYGGAPLSQPSSVEYDLYVGFSNTLPPTQWTKVGSTTNVAGDQVTLNRNAAGGNGFRFICVLEKVSPGANNLATVSVNQ